MFQLSHSYVIDVEEKKKGFPKPQLPLTQVTMMSNYTICTLHQEP